MRGEQQRDCLVMSGLVLSDFETRFRHDNESSSEPVGRLSILSAKLQIQKARQNK
jgi:hypothetical protein